MPYFGFLRDCDYAPLFTAYFLPQTSMIARPLRNGNAAPLAIASIISDAERNAMAFGLHSPWTRWAYREMSFGATEHMAIACCLLA